MHYDPANSQLDARKYAFPRTGRPLDFLWLELTNRCNLQCVHCYTESHPHAGDRDLLSAADYESLLNQAHALGCRKVQFIGGEPQLNPDFLRLTMAAKSIGFEFIEVFTNLTRLQDEVTHYAASNGICFATSVYSDDPSAHDAVTRVSSSHARTIGNLKKLLARGIETRAAIIVVNQDDAAVQRTRQFLHGLGVRHVRTSGVREFGRGETLLRQPARMSGLCGHCWAGKLCIAPDGAAYPCVMARQWQVGNVLETPLAAIVQGSPLAETRENIFQTAWVPKMGAAGGGKRPKKRKSSRTTKYCAPHEGPTKKPGCTPEPAPAEECSQSCGPDLSTCGPIGSCPQSPCGPLVACGPDRER
jgi:MoaA/NifB/PqqE/SkfB family radical SAM enzyme